MMENAKSNKPPTKKEKDRAPYEPPAIIYEGVITTRAATGIDPQKKPDNPIDPADIFSSDS
jgi:hypothetical protein